MKFFNGTYRLFDVPVVKVEQDLVLVLLMLDKKDIDGCRTGVSGQVPSNNDLKELTIWFDCLRESIPSLPESSHLKNDIIRNRILLLEKLILIRL